MHIKLVERGKELTELTRDLDVAEDVGRQVLAGNVVFHFRLRGTREQPQAEAF